MMLLSSLLLLSSSVLATPVHRRQYVGTDTSNQLTDGTPCRNVTVIFARGTFEQGNIGTVVGPEFAQQLVSDLSADQVAFQGVDYPATVAGFDAGGDAGQSTLVGQLATQAASQCPDTNLVLSGYSQGAQLVHNAAASLSSGVTNFVSSVVVFGDPDQTKPVGDIPESKVIRFCHVLDTICHGGDIITATHLTYALNVGTAAQFVIDHAESP